MSGPFEKYVEQAAEPLDPDAFDRADPQHDHWALDFRRGIARDRARKILAAVGPLIQEDTRHRMVTAAAVSLDRDGGSEQAKIEAACKATAEYIVSEIERCAGVLVAESDDKGSFLTAAVLEKAACIARVAGGLS